MGNCFYDSISNNRAPAGSSTKLLEVALAAAQAAQTQEQLSDEQDCLECGRP